MLGGFATSLRRRTTTVAAVIGTAALLVTGVGGVALATGGIDASGDAAVTSPAAPPSVRPVAIPTPPSPTAPAVQPPSTSAPISDRRLEAAERSAQARVPLPPAGASADRISHWLNRHPDYVACSSSVGVCPRDS